MDKNQDGLLNFLEVVQVIDVVAKGDHSTKMKLLYSLHLPGMVLPGELEDETDGGSSDKAEDAQGFFDQTHQAMKDMELQLLLDNSPADDGEIFVRNLYDYELVVVLLVLSVSAKMSSYKKQRSKPDDQINFRSLAARIFDSSNNKMDAGGDLHRSHKK